MASVYSRPPTFAKLNRDNYYNWKFRMQLELEYQDLWEIIDGGEEVPEGNPGRIRAWEKKARRCIGELTRHVEDSELAHIRRFAEPPQPWLAWDKLREVHEGRGWATRIQLRRRFITSQMRPQTSMQDHINQIHELADRLASIGSPVSEEDILLVLLASLPSTYDNVVVALETKSSALTVDLVTSALLNEERRQSGDTDQPAADSTLAAHAKGKTKQASANMTCHLCQKPGHFVAQCPILPAIAEALGKANPEALSHATYAKEMEETLMANCTSTYDSDSHVF